MFSIPRTHRFFLMVLGEEGRMNGVKRTQSSPSPPHFLTGWWSSSTSLATLLLSSNNKGQATGSALRKQPGQHHWPRSIGNGVYYKQQLTMAWGSSTYRPSSEGSLGLIENDNPLSSFQQYFPWKNFTGAGLTCPFHSHS